MKKSLKRKNPSVQPAAGPDISGLVVKMQEQLVNLERKVDILISRLPGRPPEVKLQPVQPVQQLQQSRQPQPPLRQNEIKQNNGFRERTLYKTICADCHKECEVPFKPSGNRPVYCKECFSRRKQSGGLFKGNNNPQPGEIKPVSVAVPPVSSSPAATKPEITKTRKPGAKKKTVSPKRKK
jgi:CxxC-x17-CxxC domain-containing protein